MKKANNVGYYANSFCHPMHTHVAASTVSRIAKGFVISTHDLTTPSWYWCNSNRESWQSRALSHMGPL